MKTHALIAAAALTGALAAGPMSAPAAAAEETPAFDFSGELIATSNYVYRGYSITSGDPAVQLGLNARHESGFGVGTNISNAKYPGTRGPEFNVKGNYVGEFDKLSYDLGVYYTNYARQEPGAKLGYVEFGALGSYAVTERLSLNAEAYYSPRLGGATAMYGFYTLGGVGYYVLDNVNVYANVGRTWYESYDGYIDYNFGVTLFLEPLAFDLKWVNTDWQYDNGANHRFVVSARFAF